MQADLNLRYGFRERLVELTTGDDARALIGPVGNDVDRLAFEVREVGDVRCRRAVIDEGAVRVEVAPTACAGEFDGVVLEILDVSLRHAVDGAVNDRPDLIAIAVWMRYRADALECAVSRSPRPRDDIFRQAVIGEAGELTILAYEIENAVRIARIGDLLLRESGARDVIGE